MSKKPKTSSPSTTKVELDLERIADLEATETDTDAIRGGGRSGPGGRAGAGAGVLGCI